MKFLDFWNWCRGEKKSWRLWAGKVLEHFKDSQMGNSDRSLEDKNSKSHVDSETHSLMGFGGEQGLCVELGKEPLVCYPGKDTSCTLCPKTVSEIDWTVKIMG